MAVRNVFLGWRNGARHSTEAQLFTEMSLGLSGEKKGDWNTQSKGDTCNTFENNALLVLESLLSRLFLRIYCLYLFPCAGFSNLALEVAVL